MKDVWLLPLLLLAFGVKSNVDARVVRQISINNEDSFRNETILLVNGKDLVMQGLLVQMYNSGNNVVRVTLNYVADENGYRAQYEYKLEQQQKNYAPALSSSALKTLVG